MLVVKIPCPVEPSEAVLSKANQDSDTATEHFRDKDSWAPHTHCKLWEWLEKSHYLKVLQIILEFA